jgi:protein subunit release factor B
MEGEPMSDRELVLSVTLADCEVQTFRAGGKGGQNQNKRDTGVRIIHHASGARGEARDERSQMQNKKAAFRRMAETETFKAWVKVTLGRDGAARAEVDRSMWPHNIRTEVRDGSGWREASL